MIIELILWSSLILIFYTYLGYPLLLKFISFFRSKAVKKGKIFPSVTFIITAHNEEATIKSKIKNSLSLDYPKNKLQIIAASDASSDETDEYVLEYKNYGVELVRTEERKGKENAQKHAVEKAKGEILIFSDIATILQPDAIINIVSNFNDSSVGCVSSVDKFIEEDGKLSGEGAYVRYEMFLRNLESRVNSLVGLSGSFFAARKEVCENWNTNLQSDFNTLLNSFKLGLRGISDPNSVGYYRNISDETKEFDRKVRTVLRGITVFFNSLSLLNPLKYAMFSWQLFSHKLMRWLVPWFQIIALITNIILAVHIDIYRVILFFHLGFYLISLLGSFPGNKLPFFKLPYYFVIVNYSTFIAWIKFLKGERIITWTPSAR